MPVLNERDYLERAVQTVLQQEVHGPAELERPNSHAGSLTWTPGSASSTIPGRTSPSP